jgi:V8-like Glu-specific endopeptidase
MDWRASRNALACLKPVPSEVLTTVSKTAVKLVDEALDEIARCVTLREIPGASTHTAIVADGLEQSNVSVALGRYLVGALAGIVGEDARLSAVMLEEGPDARAELGAAITRLIGDTNFFETDRAEHFRDTRRNAWIAEGVAHALLVVRARTGTAFLVGPVHALKAQHSIPSQQGLDMVAIYSDNSAAVVAIGESKASRNSGSDQLTEATGMFKKIDEGEYGVELRAELSSLRKVLSDDLAIQVTGALWRKSRCYLPVIVHEAPFELTGRRPTLGALEPPVERLRLLALRLADFHAFFDAVADAMRAALAEVVT